MLIQAFATIRDILAKYGDTGLSLEREVTMERSAIRGSRRDDLGNFSIVGAFCGSDWSAPNASEFEFNKSYPGKHTVQFKGHLHDDLTTQDKWEIASILQGGFFYFQPLAIQAPLSELEGHGPKLLSHRADTHCEMVRWKEHCHELNNQDEAKGVLDAVYSFMPNSPEHLLQVFGPRQVVQPGDVAMFMCHAQPPVAAQHRDCGLRDVEAVFPVVGHARQPAGAHDFSTANWTFAYMYNESVVPIGVDLDGRLL